jgi:hypothetical protein
VRDPSGAVCAAVGVSGPIERIRTSSFKTLALDVIQAADGISETLRAGSVAPATASSARRLSVKTAI